MSSRDVERILSNLRSLESDNERISILAKLDDKLYSDIADQAAAITSLDKRSLDKRVGAMRIKQKEKNKNCIVETIEPHEEPSHIEELLNEIERSIRRYVVLEESDYSVLALWIAASYVYNSFSIFPRLLLSSAEKRCGKSTCAEVIEAYTHRALLACNISPSAVFRVIEKYHPTLIIDEADSFLKASEELRGIINSSHNVRTARVVKSEGRNGAYEPASFSTWTPMVIVGIGSFQETLQDRSIIIRLKRRKKTETVEKLPRDFFECKKVSRRKLIRFRNDHADILKRTRTNVPSCENDRTGDNWYPLFCIAKLAGEEWLKKVRTAFASKISVEEDDSIGVQLLVDINNIFSCEHCDSISSAQLVNKLNAISESPWCEWSLGKGLNQRSLSKLLKPFGIRTRQKNDGYNNLKSYFKQDFEDVFSRYLPATSANTLYVHKNNRLGDSSTLYQSDEVAPKESTNQLITKVNSVLAVDSLPIDENQGGKPDVEQF